MSEQAHQELEEFLALAEVHEGGQPLDATTEMMLLAKGMALQQAGIIPLDNDRIRILDCVRTALTLEGLLRGH